MIFYSFRSLVIAYAILIAVVLLVLLSTFSNFRYQEKQLGNIRVSRVALQKLEPAVENFNGFVYGMESYINSGGEQNSDFYKEGLIKLKNDSLQIIEIANADSVKQDKIDYKILAQLLHDITVLAATILHLKEVQGPDAARIELKKGGTLKIKSEFKILVEKVEASNRKTLSSAYNRSITLARRTFVFTGIIAGLLVLILIVSFVVGYKDIKHRLSYNRNLEKEVREQTSAIRKSEEKYRTIIEQASDGIFIADQDAFIIDANNSGCNMIGYTKEELRKMKFTELIAPKNLREDPINFNKLNSGNTVINERKLIRKDGSEISVEISAKLLSGGWYQSIIRDITDRKKTEAKLIEQEEQLRLFVEHSPASLAMVDQDMRYIMASRRWMTDYNIGDKQITGKSHYEIFPDIPQRWKDINTRCLAGTSEKNDEDSFIRPDGSIEWLRWEIHPWYKASGEIGGIIMFTENITERKKAEEALSNNELRFRTLTSNAPVGIFQTDAKGKTIYVNETWLGYTGMKFNEAMGDGWVEAVHRDDRQMLIKVWQAKSQKGLRSSSEYRLVHKNGNIRWVSGTAVPLFNKANEITGHMGTLSDITERKNTEQLISKAKELTDKMIDSLPGIFYMFDKTGRYIRWNKLKEKITEYTAKELGEMHPLDFFEGAEKDLIRDCIVEGFNTGKTEVEAHLVSKSGKRLPYYFTGVVIEYEGKPCMIGMGIDISERKKAEQELDESYKAIRKLTAHLQNIREEERTHIAREIHDELGQHLTVLKMDISWLSKKIYNSADNETKQKMDGLLGMLDGTIKTVRRISSELRPSLLDDLGLEAAIEWQLEEFEKRSGIETSFVETGKEFKFTTAIKTGLFRIFQESLTNVARHAGASKVVVTFKVFNNNLVLNITDNGKGFDKFKIADKRTLGLLGMKERTEMIGGTYEITSKSGKGTTVVVSVPLEDNIL